jgi:hypothetical protein
MSASTEVDRANAPGFGAPREPGSGGLAVVAVTETVVSALTGREDCRYTSPPQPREQAMTLVRLLVGAAGTADNGAERWSVPIAGGRRVVTLSGEPKR